MSVRGSVCQLGKGRGFLVMSRTVGGVSGQFAIPRYRSVNPFFGHNAVHNVVAGVQVRSGCEIRSLLPVQETAVLGDDRIGNGRESLPGLEGFSLQNDFEPAVRSVEKRSAQRRAGSGTEKDGKQSLLDWHRVAVDRVMASFPEIGAAEFEIVNVKYHVVLSIRNRLAGRGVPQHALVIDEHGHGGLRPNWCSEGEHDEQPDQERWEGFSCSHGLTLS